MISFVQFLILLEDVPTEVETLARKHKSPLKFGLALTRLQMKKGTDLGGSMDVEGAAHHREALAKWYEIHGTKKKKKKKKTIIPESIESKKEREEDEEITSKISQGMVKRKLGTSVTQKLKREKIARRLIRGAGEVEGEYQKMKGDEPLIATRTRASDAVLRQNRSSAEPSITPEDLKNALLQHKREIDKSSIENSERRSTGRLSRRAKESKGQGNLFTKIQSPSTTEPSEPPVASRTHRTRSRIADRYRKSESPSGHGRSYRIDQNRPPHRDVRDSFTKSQSDAKKEK
jgi:hypothetical protein